jgi:hypothetical protein
MEHLVVTACDQKSCGSGHTNMTLSALLSKVVNIMSLSKSQ